MAALTPDQIAKLMQVIRDASTAVAVATAGYEITEEERQRLEDEGYLGPGAAVANLVFDSFVFGQVMQQSAAAKGWTYEQLQKHLTDAVSNYHKAIELRLELLRRDVDSPEAPEGGGL